MTVTSDGELVKRIAKLAKQNQELEAKIRELEKINEKLIRENERIKGLYEKASAEHAKEAFPAGRQEKSFKFNMGTVLYS